MTRAHRTSQPLHSPEFARGYVRRLIGSSAIERDMAEFQLEAIAAAARNGRPILIVEDVDAIARRQPAQPATSQ